MENLIELTELELISLDGGKADAMTQGSSFGQDVGYVCGWIIGAFCNAASMIKG